MGTVYKSSYTISIPENATIVGNTVIWTGKDGKKKTGKLTTGRNGSQKVLIETKLWIAKFQDENGKTKIVSTKAKTREAAQLILNKHEADVNRIRAGLASREEIDQKTASKKDISYYIEKFEIKMKASGVTSKHIIGTMQRINDLIEFCSITNLSEIERGKIEKWIAHERDLQESSDPDVKKRSNSTINHYLTALKAFSEWSVENGYLEKDPLKKIKKLNKYLKQKKNRRSFTEDELKRLFEAAKTRFYKGKNKSEEHILAYKLLAGTGLRSSELGKSTLSQFNFERNTFRIKADNTKNKKEGVLPVRSDLMKMLKEWTDKHEIKAGERIFSYNAHSILNALLLDLKAAGINQIGDDGRSLDVHSLRRTFGTMLARAGVPLTTTQRLMRHSTPELTAKLYIDVEEIDMSQAVAKLPGF